MEARETGSLSHKWKLIQQELPAVLDRDLAPNLLGCTEGQRGRHAVTTLLYTYLTFHASLR